MNRYLFLLCALFTYTLQAQQATVQIRGAVLDAYSSQPMEYVTVAIKSAVTENILSGTTTTADGKFSATSDSTAFYVEISFIGFETKTIKEFELNNNLLDLGTVMLNASSESLDEVSVRAERSQTEFRLDKRVFNVGKDLSTTGAGALEVLNNVPSVNVDLEGQVSLRGNSGVQILINGKPSVIASESGNALNTITADMIEKIEVITNPSAKYEAEGTAGIINIVIKKEDRRGINGSVTLNTGTPHNHSLGLSLNRRTEKLNLFTQVGVGYRELPTDITFLNWNYPEDQFIRSVGEEFRNENFYNFVLGTDYFIDSFNVITLSGNFAYEIEDQPSAFQFERLNFTSEEVAVWERTETTEATNPKYQYEFQYKRDFRDHKEHFLLFSALGNFFGKDQFSEFLTEETVGISEQGNQRTRTDFREARFTFNLDYTHPFKEDWIWETGAQYVMNDVSNDFEVSDSIGGEWVSNPGLTNEFQFDQKVLGTYTTLAFERDRWGIKLGIRGEYTDVATLLVTTGESNDRNFVNLFPSGHTSFKVSEKVSLQAGYSRRIYRPRLWDLNPFFNIRNNFAVRRGNPDLQPEFTDSYELTSIYIFPDVSFNAGVYHQYTTDLIERITLLEDEISVTAPYNVGASNTTGVELNGKYTPWKNVTLTGDFNYGYFSRQVALDSLEFSFNGQRWSSRLTTKFKLPWEFEVELIGRYRSSFETTQGNEADNIYADMGVRKKLLGGKAIINFSVRDIFASRVDVSTSSQEFFLQASQRQRGRFITLGFSYGFGKGEAMEFSGKKRF